MSSNGEDIIRETFEKLGDAIGVQMQIPDAMIANLGAVLQAQIDLLAELQSAGRLLADDEMRLTAEQVEDVRTAREALRGYRNFGEYARLPVRRLIAAVDALFPATEPAEGSVGDPLQAWKEFLKPKPIGWYRTMELDFAAKHFGFPSNPVFEDRYTAPDGGKWQWTDELQWELRCYPPAPAEPAEDIRGLIEKSSLGTESAQALISTVSPEHGRRVAQEAARREAGTKVKLTELQRDLLQRIVDQWTKGAGWTHVFWSGTVEALISAGCIVRHEEAFNEYRPTIFGEKALAPAEPAEERRSFPTIQDVPNNTLFHTHGGNGSSLFVRNQSGDLRLCLNAGPEWSKLLRDGDFPPSSGPYVEVPWSKFPQPPADPFAQPAPAEPAKEETKAETLQEKVADLESQLEEEIANRDAWEQRLTNLIYSLATVGEVGEWTSSDDLDEKFIDHIRGKIQQLERAALAARGEGWYEGYEVGLEYGPIAASGEEYDGPINPYDVPASSPVVPAPTETGPWKHRVNGEICVASPASGLPYTIGKFNDHGDFVWHSSSAELPEGFAPFVAAKEG